ncbi:MAG: molybdopterin dinucleotide binding domain-containing protein [Roseobacter sp.]
MPVGLRHVIAGREPISIPPDDAEAYNIRQGDVPEVFNARERFLAKVKITDDVRQGCVFLWTGARYDPDFDAPQNQDRHGNPNGLTHDVRKSSLTQSHTAHSTMVQIRRFYDPAPHVKAHDPPSSENQS